MDEKTKVHLTEVQETLLVTLHAKAVDSHSKNSILDDQKAGELVDRIDYDYKKHESLGNDNFVVVRAKQYDEWLKEFLETHPMSVVLNLGCGLDTRVTRIHPSREIRWFDVDYPDVIRLREKFYSNADGYRMIGSPLTDPNWLTEIPIDRPAMIIAEGVLGYLTKEEARTLLNRLTDHFPHGQIAFDVMNAFGLESARSRVSGTTGALHQWAVENLEEVDRLDPKLERINDLPLFASPFISKLPWSYRLAYGLLSLFPQYRDTIRLLRYQF